MTDLSQESADARDQKEVGLTLFGQGPGGSVSKYKLTDLSNESPPRLTAPKRNGWVKFVQNTFKAIQSYVDS